MQRSGIDTTKYHTFPRHLGKVTKTQGNITRMRALSRQVITRLQRADMIAHQRQTSIRKRIHIALEPSAKNNNNNT